ncbi:restriction endonuclease subunit S [Acidaminococcus timonensis]|uniref:restriction endonuclease subunit S n=1 Tax=Acidaminococcus timonensis TaxID=1871002 RepID=UPI00307BCCB9
MAGKKQSLTPEEKLSQALLPREEWPYELPKGWVWTRIETCVKVSKEKTDDFRNPLLKYVGLENFESNKGIISFSSASNVKSTKNVFHSGQILYGKLRPYLNKHDIVDFEGICSTDILVIDTLNICIPSYFNSYLDLDQFIAYAIQNSKGINLPRVNENTIMQVAFPLPPLPEQQRIVARIESLFAKLDAARDKLQQVLDTQEARRAAILHEAFTGRLTGHKGSAEGRGKREEEGAQNPEGTEFVPEGWKKVKLTEVCAINPKKISTKELDNSLKVSFFPMASLDERLGKITKPEIRTLSEVKKGFTNFSEADVVLAKITPCFENGKAAIIGPLMNHIGYGTTEFFVLRSTQDLYNKFLFYFIRSPKFRSEAKAHMTGAVGQQRVPKDFIENYSFMLPPLEEQCRIVDILDSLLNKEYQASTIAQSSLSQIDLLKKSILARAFRGQLGTQDPSDPDARDLLTSE